MGRDAALEQREGRAARHFLLCRGAMVCRRNAATASRGNFTLAGHLRLLSRPHTSGRDLCKRISQTLVEPQRSAQPTRQSGYRLSGHLHGRTCDRPRQGSMTSLPLIVAEELDADWSKVRVVAAPPIDAIYGNPGFGGMMYTAGSNAVRSYYQPLRTFGAQVRRVLLDNAANKLGVPVDELTTEPSVVVHAKSGRRLSYGEIAAFAQVPDRPPEIKPEQLKKPSQFRLIGKDVMRVDLPGKVNGTAPYAIDVQVPGMLYGAVLRAPVEGAAPDKIDESKARAVAGVIKVIRMPYGVGVVAETP